MVFDLVWPGSICWTCIDSIWQFMPVMRNLCLISPLRDCAPWFEAPLQHWTVYHPVCQREWWLTAWWRQLTPKQRSCTFLHNFFHSIGSLFKFKISLQSKRSSSVFLWLVSSRIGAFKHAVIAWNDGYVPEWRDTTKLWVLMEIELHTETSTAGGVCNTCHNNPNGPFTEGQRTKYASEWLVSYFVSGSSRISVPGWKALLMFIQSAWYWLLKLNYIHVGSEYCVIV